MHPLTSTKRILHRFSLEGWLFLAALLVYLLTRVIGLPNFPIFFFTDEAVQTMSAADLIQNGLRNASGAFLPTYFENGSQFNLSLSVYLQVLPTLLLGRSIWVTRGTAVLATLVAALGLGLILRDFFKVKYTWLGPLVLSVIPAWFLHSRTAFETSLMASMYCAFLYFYLCYRTKYPKYLYLALILGALTFYAYSPGQVVIVLTGLFLFFSDLGYHWQQRRTAIFGILLLMLLVLPYLRFRYLQPTELTHHLSVLKSYWLEDISLMEKLRLFALRYLQGLNPAYWYLPNNVDLIRHQMIGMGHLPMLSFPFLLIGLWKTLRQFKSSAYRTLIFAVLVAPSGAALVDITITRVLVLIIPVTLLTALGIDVVMQWLGDHSKPKLLPGLLAFAFLTFASFQMLYQSLTQGPTWYDNYGLYGMQYGGQPLFDKIKAFQESHPGKSMHLSPSWANGTDVIARFFMGDPLPIKIGTIEPYTLCFLPLDREMVFIMLPNEYTWMLETGKFTQVEVLDTLAYPNGETGFYFVSLDYVENVEAIFADEIAARRKPQVAELMLYDRPVTVQYPLLDINEIQHAFDGDKKTFIRTFEANPLRIQLDFTDPVPLRSVTALVGGTSTRFSVSAHPFGAEDTVFLADQVGGSNQVRPISLQFEETLLVDQLIVEVLSLNDGDFAHVHLWEIILE